MLRFDGLADFFIVRQKQYIHSAAKLTKWLGIESVEDPHNPGSQEIIARKKDPKCRFMYVFDDNSTF
jgi:hypothetical protein